MCKAALLRSTAVRGGWGVESLPRYQKFGALVTPSLRLSSTPATATRIGRFVSGFAVRSDPERDIKKAKRARPISGDESKRPHSAAGKFPVKRYLPESHAIVSYLAEGSDLTPQGRSLRPRTDVAVAVFRAIQFRTRTSALRFWLQFVKKTESELGEKCGRSAKNGYAALSVLRKRIEWKIFFGGTALLARGHFALRIHARGARRRLRSCRLS